MCKSLISRVLALILSTIVILSCFSGCHNTNDNGDDTSAQTDLPVEEILVNLFENGQSNYSIVRWDNENDVKIASSLHDYILSKFGIEIDVKSAELGYGKTPNPNAKEILIGSTGREESEKALEKISKYCDYIIDIQQYKIVINANSALALSDVIIYFEKSILNEGYDKFMNDSKLTLSSKQSYIYDDEKYAISSLMVNGENISKYKIVYPASVSCPDTINTIEYIRNIIGKVCGYIVPIVSDETTETENEILFGNTNRTGDDSFYTGTGKVKIPEYAVAVNGSKLILAAGGLSAEASLATHLDNVLSYIKDSYNFSSNYRNETDAAFDQIERAEGTVLRIMTSNVLVKVVNMEYRPNYLAECYLQYLPDVLCLEEVLGSRKWYTYLLPLISDEYEAVQAWPKAGTDIVSNPVPIFVRKDKFNILESGCFCTYNEESNSEYTYAVIQDKESSMTYIIYALHLAATNYVTNAETVRQESSMIFIAHLKALQAKYPSAAAISAGDYNDLESSQTYKNFTSVLADSKYVATISSDTNLNTGHTLGSMPSSGKTRNYDLILVDNSKLEVLTHYIVTNNYAINGSDHCPVFIDVCLK